MKIGLLAQRSNSISFFVPLAKFLNENGINSFFLFPKNNDVKYNSLSLEKNLKKTISILEKNNIPYYSIDKLEDFDGDFLFSIESNGFKNPIPRSKRKFKHIIIQNYHDFSFSAQYPTTKKIYDESNLIWVNFHWANEILKEIKYPNNVFFGMLPYFWHYENLSKKDVLNNFDGFDVSDKIALCFLPREKETITDTWKDVFYTPYGKIKTGNPSIKLKHAEDFSNFLKEKGFKIIFKQREKNRNLNFCDRKNYFEDLNFFPNTGLDLLFVSSVAFGYMTSAVLDAVVFESNYINFYEKIFSDFSMRIFENYRDYSNINYIDFNESFEDIKSYDRIYPPRYIFNFYISETKKRLLRFLEKNGQENIL